MPGDPIIVAKNVVLDNGTEQLQERWINDLRVRWLAGLVFTVISFVWLIFRTDLSREPQLPNRPLTRADVPLIEKKIKYLKKDAETAGSYYPHLRNNNEIQAAQRALEEVFYTPEVFPAAEQLHDVQNARILELSPDLAKILQARQKYEEARYAIANDPAITDKAAAIAALDNRTDPAAIGPEYSRTDAQVLAMRADFVGDPEFDQAQTAFHNASETAILKRHPELAAFYHEFDNRDQAYHFFMAQANDLTRQMKVLKGESVPPPPTPVVPGPAHRYGVKVGDTVDISALNPVVAAHHALITGMNDDQLTIRVGSDTFAVRWENVDRLKAESK